MKARLTEQQAIEIKRRHSAEFFSRPGVSGVGVEFDSHGPILVVHFNQDATVPGNIPKEVEGLRVDVQHSGPFVAQEK